MTKTAHRVFTAFVVILLVTPRIGTRFATLLPTVRAVPGDVLYRANAGGTIAVSDGPDGQPAAESLVAGGEETTTHGQPTTIDSSVSAGTPSAIWDAERWDFDIVGRYGDDRGETTSFTVGGDGTFDVDVLTQFVELTS